MNKKEIPQEIIAILGLTSYEIKIFEAISGIGKKISTIARITKIPRTSLLYILKKLEKRKLVKSVKNGGYYHWKTMLPFIFSKIHNQDIIILKGRNEMFTVLEKLTKLPKNSRIYGIQPDKSLKQVVKKNPLIDLLNINQILKDRCLIFEGIVHEKSVNNIIKEFGKEKAKKIFNSFIGRLEDYVKIPDDFADVESEIYIFDGSAYILNWNKEIGLEIHDENIVSLLIAMFSCVKEFGQRYSQNKKMEIYKNSIEKIIPPNMPPQHLS